MIDNRKTLLPLMKFENENDFYFLQLIQRRKENPDLEKAQVVIKDYFIYSHEYLEKKWNEIVSMCNEYNARAYLRLNRRNNQKVAGKMLKELATKFDSGNFGGLQKLFNKCAGQCMSEPKKRWIVDIDVNDQEFVDMIVELISIIQRGIKNKEYKVLATIKTKNGYHVITEPFDLHEFKNSNEIVYSTLIVDVHKDNPTILYCP